MGGIRLALQVALGLGMVALGGAFLMMRLFLRVEVRGLEIDLLAGRVGYLGIAVVLGFGIFQLFGVWVVLRHRRAHDEAFARWATYEAQRSELSPADKAAALAEIVVRDHVSFPYACCQLNLDVLEECRLVAPQLVDQIGAIEEEYEEIVSKRVREKPEIMLQQEAFDIGVRVADDLRLTEMLDRLFEDLFPQVGRSPPAIVP